MRSASSFPSNVGRATRNSRIFSSMMGEWFHNPAAISGNDPLMAVRPRSGPMRPPVPRTAWHSTQPFETKSACPRIGSPRPRARRRGCRGADGERDGGGRDGERKRGGGPPRRHGTVPRPGR